MPIIFLTDPGRRIGQDAKPASPIAAKPQTRLDAYLATIESPMRRAKACDALQMQVRVNGAEFMTRAALIERRISAGAKIAERKSGQVLESPGGAFLDRRNATAAGLDYAVWLSARQT